jgi:hypothetical protein
VEWRASDPKTAAIGCSFFIWRAMVMMKKLALWLGGAVALHGVFWSPPSSGQFIYPPREAVQTFAEAGDEFRMELARSATLLMLLSAVVIGDLLLWLISRNFYRATLLRLKHSGEFRGTSYTVSTLNPLTWKREYQLALICAAALGVLVGAIFGFFYLNPNRHFEVWCSEASCHSSG